MTTYKSYIEYDWRDGSYRFVEIPEWENGIPFDVHHGLCVWFGLAHREYDKDEIVQAFKEGFGERLEETRKKFDVVWNGHNHVAQWEGEEDSQEVWEEHMALDDEILSWSEKFGFEIWDASDYFYGGLTFEQIVRELKITAATTDDELNDIVTYALDEAFAQGIKLEKMHEFVEHIRAQLIEEKEEEAD